MRIVIIAIIRNIRDVPIAKILYLAENVRMIVRNKLIRILPKMRL